MAKIISQISIKKVLLFCLFFRIILVLVTNWHPDVGNHVDWGNKYWSYGASGFYYESVWNVGAPNQPFGSIYLFALISKLHSFLMDIVQYCNSNFDIFPSKLVWIFEEKLHYWLVKLPFVLADIGIGYLIFKILTHFKSKYATLGALTYLLNPIVIYNSTVWGQTDSLINLLALAGIWLFFRKHFLIGTFLFWTTFTFKISLVFYIPVYFLLVFKYRSQFFKLIFYNVITFLILLILVIPFAVNRGILAWPMVMYRDLVLNNQGSMLNGNAFNLWALIYGIDLTKRDSSVNIVNIPVKYIAYLITSFFSAIIIIKSIRQPLTFQNIMRLCFMLGLTIFIFMTNMHERYLYPIFPVFTILLFLRANGFKLRDYLAFTLLHLINLYNLWFYPMIGVIFNTLTYNNYAICRLFSIIFLVYYGLFLLEYLKGESN